jgi:hypothetical protein
LVPQIFKFFGRKLEHEILGKTSKISFDGPVQGLGSCLIKHGQIIIQQDSLATQQINTVLDTFRRNDGSFGHGRTFVLADCILLPGNFCPSPKGV